MKLRTRLVLMLAVLGMPSIFAIAMLEQRAQRSAIVESTYEAAVQQMEQGGLAACEALADRVERPGRRRRLLRRPMPRRERFVYDEEFRPTFPGQTAIDPELRAELEGGSATAVQWLTNPPRARIAMRMPDGGRCAVLVIERPAPGIGARAWLSSLAWAGLIASITGIIALIAMGPIVRRLRALARDVRRGKGSGWTGEVKVSGNDEVAELGRAFNEASAEIRSRVDELSTRDKALTEFVQNTSHDVMVPLTVLQGHLSKLRSAIPSGANGGEIVESAIDEAHYLGSLLRNLSAAARLDAGEPQLHHHAIDLRETVERVVLRHQTIAREHGIALDHAVPEQAAPIEADSTLAEQAIGNLVLNAIRYNKKGGHVAVVLDRSRAGFRIRVIDDGPGIPRQELERIAERRFRGGAARARRPTGMGLGLHIVRGVAERHGWDLRFESPPEGGLVVTLSGPIPLKQD